MPRYPRAPRFLNWRHVEIGKNLEKGENVRIGGNQHSAIWLERGFDGTLRRATHSLRDQRTISYIIYGANGKRKRVLVSGNKVNLRKDDFRRAELAKAKERLLLRLLEEHRGTIH